MPAVPQHRLTCTAMQGAQRIRAKGLRGAERHSSKKTTRGRQGIDCTRALHKLKPALLFITIVGSPRNALTKGNAFSETGFTKKSLYSELLIRGMI